MLTRALLASISRLAYNFSQPVIGNERCLPSYQKNFHEIVRHTTSIVNAPQLQESEGTESWLRHSKYRYLLCCFDLSRSRQNARFTNSPTVQNLMMQTVRDVKRRKRWFAIACENFEHDDMLYHIKFDLCTIQRILLRWRVVQDTTAKLKWCLHESS